MGKWISERDGALYEVFGRGRPDEPLVHIGSLTAPNLALARSRARMMYAEKAWVELSIARADGFVNLIGSDQPADVGFA